MSRYSSFDFGALTSDIREVEVLFTKYNNLVLREIYQKFIKTKSNETKYGKQIISYADFKKNILRKRPRRLKKRKINKDGLDIHRDMDAFIGSDAEKEELCCMKVDCKSIVRRCRNYRLENEDFCHIHIRMKDLSDTELPFGRFYDEDIEEDCKED